MTVKTARAYTLEELKEKSQKTLADPKLVEIVKTAPLNKNGKVNLSWVYEEAEKYVHEQTKDLQKTKELAVATRFLAMLRRDFAEEFERLVAQKEQVEVVKIAKHKKPFHEIEFKLAHGIGEGVELTTRESGWGHAWQIERRMRFCSDRQNDDLSPRAVGKKFCMEILNALIETADPPGDMDLMNDLIELLEKKFGLKVKVCGNCEHFHNKNWADCFPFWSTTGPFSECTRHLWVPKEVSAEKNLCQDCGNYVENGSITRLGICLGADLTDPIKCSRFYSQPKKT